MGEGESIVFLHFDVFSPAAALFASALTHFGLGDGDLPSLFHCALQDSAIVFSSAVGREVGVTGNGEVALLGGQRDKGGAFESEEGY